MQSGRKGVRADRQMILRYDLKPGTSKMNVGVAIVETLKLLIRRRLGME